LRKGFQLPASYCDFATEFGYGLLCNLLIIYLPMKGGDTLPLRSKELAGMLHQTMASGFFEYGPDGSPDLVSRLVPFGISENGHTLAWDPELRKNLKEPLIYVVGPKCLAVRKGAPNLYTFVEQCLDERVRGMLGPGYNPLNATFRPLKPA
jgi:hypothetical protein